MMTLTRHEIEILLDSPECRDYVVSAYADMTVKNGFTRDVELHLKNQARAAADALRDTQARKDLEANIAVVKELVAEQAGTSSRGLAIFSSLARGLSHVVPLDFEVENRLIIDEEPYLLPILERWYGEPTCLAVVLDSNEAHLFSAHWGHSEWYRDLERNDAAESFERDKPRFNYKKRFTGVRHERQHALDDEKFLHEIRDAILGPMGQGQFAGLILLGQPPITAALRRLLPREIEDKIAGEAAHAMTQRPEDISDEVGKILERWKADQDRQILSELRERWKRNHLIGNGPVEVLDALQQGRATSILFGYRRDIAGARCNDCNYRFGVAVDVCPYCEGSCRTVNAVQEILRMAMRHRIPVHMFRQEREDPLASVDVAAFLKAEANWTPTSAAR
jgi:hypothetical protein